MTITLHVDLRERLKDTGFEEDLKKASHVEVQFNVIHESLALGDYVITDDKDNTVVAIVERKSFSDFMASLRPAHMEDLRLKDQMQRLEEASSVGIRVLLVECAKWPCQDRAIEKSLQTLTAGLVTKGILLVRVQDNAGFMYFLKGLMYKVSTIQHAGGTNFNELMVAVRKSRTDTPEKLYHSFLQLVPGVSISVARQIAAEYKTTRDLRHACRTSGSAAITKLKHNNRSLSVKVAEALCTFFSQA
jgi:ERCC4-type nuclease